MKDLIATRRWPMWALLALCIARLWLVPLSSSFWVDELVTAFVVKYPAHPSFAVAPQVPQSVYYWLPRIALAISGPSEVSFRIPSMLVMAIALWLAARLAARLIHPAAGWFAVFAALSLRGVDYHAIDARPYALGMMVSAAAIFFLVRWLDTAHWRDAAALVVGAALLWRVHLLFWPFYLVLAAYAAARLLRKDTPVPWPQWIIVVTATIVSLLPQAFRAIALARNAQAHVIVPPPTLHEFEHELKWNVPLLCGVAAYLWNRRLRGRALSLPENPDTGAWILILCWWLIHPLCIFLYSHLTGNSIYVDRYLSLMLPGVALTATACVALSMPATDAAQRWRLAAAGMAVAALVTQGHLGSAWYRHDISDWRTAAQEVTRFSGDAAAPVVIPSPFVEAREPAWTPEYPLPGFLYAHLERYSVTGTPYLFPFDSPAGSPGGVSYALQLLKNGALLRAGKWSIYGPQRHVRDWRQWFAQRPELAGWSSTIQEFGDVFVAEFRRE
jgi:hypothetical protein